MECEFENFISILSTRLMEECQRCTPEGHLTSELRQMLESCTIPVRRMITSKTTNNCAPLFIACRKASLTIVDYLINVCNADIEQQGKFELPVHQPVQWGTPLWCAAFCGNLPLVKFLVEYGAKVDAVSETDSTPVRAACYMNHIDVVKYLVQRGADIKTPNFSGITCLMNAIQDPEVCQYLLECGVDVNAADRCDKTALHYAIEASNLATTKLLLECNANPYLQCSCGDDALQTACLVGDIDIFEYIVRKVPYSQERLADAHELMGSTSFDEKRNAPLAIKLWIRALDIRKAAGMYGVPLPKRPTLWKREVYGFASEFTTMQELWAIENDLDAIKIQSLLICERVLGPHHQHTLIRLMYRGSTYDMESRHQRCIDLWFRALKIRVQKFTILSIETMQTAQIIVKLMLNLSKKTFEMHHENTDKALPRFYDVSVMIMTLASQLKRSEAKMAKRPTQGIWRAAYDRVVQTIADLIYLLVKMAASKDDRIMTKKMVCTLMELNPTTAEGNTLLHLCAPKHRITISRHVEIIELLLECGANVNARNANRVTPLHIASERRNFIHAAVKLMLDYGAHLDIPDITGRTPIGLLSSQPGNNLNLMKYISLQCHAARAITKYGISYKNEPDIPARVHRFIEAHGIQ